MPWFKNKCYGEIVEGFPLILNSNDVLTTSAAYLVLLKETIGAENRNQETKLYPIDESCLHWEPEKVNNKPGKLQEQHKDFFFFLEMNCAHSAQDPCRL